MTRVDTRLGLCALHVAGVCQRLLAAVVAIVFATAAGSAGARDLPTATELFDRLGFSEEDRDRAFCGELVSHEGTELSSRDLAIVMAYVVDTHVDALVAEFSRGVDYGHDSTVVSFGTLDASASASALAALQLGPEASHGLRLYGDPDPGMVNFSREEAAALRAVDRADGGALEARLRALILARYRSYRSRGLLGIPPYQRREQAYSPADDLMRAVDVVTILDEYAPSFQRTLREYPRYKAPGLGEQFFWVEFELDERPTFVLSHRLSLELDDGVHVMAERQFYVSRGYNAVHEYGGLFPVAEGTLLFHSSRVFTDRAAGFASGAKHALGRRMMARRYGAILESYRAAAPASCATATTGR